MKVPIEEFADVLQVALRFSSDQTTGYVAISTRVGAAFRRIGWNH